jgi:hypothetical protein
MSNLIFFLCRACAAVIFPLRLAHYLEVEFGWTKSALLLLFVPVTCWSELRSLQDNNMLKIVI